MDPNPATATTGFIDSAISIGDDSDELHDRVPLKAVRPELITTDIIRGVASAQLRAVTHA